MALDDDSWHTVAEVAEHLNITTRHVERLIARGELESRRFGPRMRRVSRSAVRRYVERAPKTGSKDTH